MHHHHHEFLSAVIINKVEEMMSRKVNLWVSPRIKFYLCHMRDRKLRDGQLMLRSFNHNLMATKARELTPTEHRAFPGGLQFQPIRVHGHGRILVHYHPHPPVRCIRHLAVPESECLMPILHLEAMAEIARARVSVPEAVEFPELGGALPPFV